MSTTVIQQLLGQHTRQDQDWPVPQRPRCSFPVQIFEMRHNDCMTPSSRLGICILVFLLMVVSSVSGQTPPSTHPTERPAPPTRDPHTPGYVAAKELADGANPPANADGNFIIGPTHQVPPETATQGDVPKGTVIEFMMNSS